MGGDAERERMDPRDLSDDDLDQLAQQLAGRLPSGTHGDRVVLSRRQFALAASGVLSAGALMALGVDEASAQAAAGQVGTSSDPVDAFAYTLDVQNGAEFNGTDISGVGSVSADSIGVTDGVTLSGDDNGPFIGTGTSITASLSDVYDTALIFVRARDTSGSPSEFAVQLNGITGGYNVISQDGTQSTESDSGRIGFCAGQQSTAVVAIDKAGSGITGSPLATGGFGSVTSGFTVSTSGNGLSSVTALRSNSTEWEISVVETAF